MNTVQEKGYTILELMIVLAVSAGMFGVVATTFGGRQQQVQFTQAVRDFDSRLKDIRNDVSLGYYPANELVKCSVVGGEPKIEDKPAVALGSNDDCVSIGKVVQFSPGTPDELDADESDQTIKVYNVVGLRRDSDDVTPTTVIEAIPTAIKNPEHSLLKWGLRVKRVVYTNPLTGISADTFGVAIFTELNRGSQLKASASDEAVQIGAIPGVLADITESQMISKIRDINDSDFNNASQIVICVTDADDNQKATVTFGGSTSGSVIDFDNYDEAVCEP